MKYAVDRAAPEPAYLQLYRQLRADIVAALWRRDEKLPSKRLLADETGVSVITVEHAYGLLCDEGYAEARPRSGYFVTYRKNDLYSVRETALPAIPAPAPAAVPDFPFSTFAKTMRNVISKYGEQILQKSPNFGHLYLRETLARYLARSRGVRVAAEQIVIGSGAEYLYGLAVQWLGRDRVFAVENPCYEKIDAVYAANGVICERLRLGKDGILSEELARSRAAVLHVTPFYSFPSGVTASASKRAEYLRFAAARDALIIEDDFASEFNLSKKHVDTLFSLDPERVLYVNTFSRTVAPSMRVGYMVLPERLVASFSQRVGFYSCTVPVFEQLVLAEFIAGGDFERHINRTRRRMRKG